jgi:hypothetical protein
MEEQLKQLTEIRSLMERSSRFISLSGLSGVAAGTIALAGSAVAYWYGQIYYPQTQIDENSLLAHPLLFMISLAALVLFLALSFGIYFTVRNSKKKQLKIWDRTTRRLIINLFIPLTAGGLFIFILLFRQMYGYTAGLTLLFYGLALLNAGHYTFSDIRVLGIFEIILGLLALWLIGYGLYFWAIGFGVLHIVYGLLVYKKYERNQNQV